MGSFNAAGASYFRYYHFSARDSVDFGHGAAALADFVVGFLMTLPFTMARRFALQKSQRPWLHRITWWALNPIFSFTAIVVIAGVFSHSFLQIVPAGYYGWKEAIDTSINNKLNFEQSLQYLNEAQSINLRFTENRNRTAEFLYQKARLLASKENAGDASLALAQARKLYEGSLPTGHTKVVELDNLGKTLLLSDPLAQPSK